MEEETPPSPMWAAESHQGAKAVSAEGPGPIWISRANALLEPFGVLSSEGSYTWQPGQPSVIQQLQYWCAAQNLALSKAQVIYGSLRWRVEPGYLRSDNVVKRTPAFVSGNLRRASLRPLFGQARGDHSPTHICVIRRCRVLLSTHWSHHIDYPKFKSFNFQCLEQ